MADSPSLGGKTSPGTVTVNYYGPNEYERFGNGRTLEEYKEQELASVENLKDESDAELERKREVYLGLIFEAEGRGNPHGLIEFNRARFDKISGIVQRRHRQGNRRATIVLCVIVFSISMLVTLR